MIPRPIAILSVCACLLLSPALPQGNKASFDGQAAFEYTKALASDSMMGRKSGEPGGAMGADYVVSKLKEWGVEPAGPKGSYFQDMTYEYYEVERGATLNIVAHNRNREFVYSEDWRQHRYSGSGTIGADIIFVGYGISAPKQEYDDYSGIDVKGKLVLFSTDTPRRFQDKLREESQLQNRIKAAQDHGARGVLTFRGDGQSAVAFFRGGLKKDIYRPDFVIISVESKVVDFIFKWQRADPRYFFQQIESTGKPQSYDMAVRSMINLRVIFDEKRPTQNVLARITGSDEKLRNEYVVIGAHMDHLGIDMTGDVLNGADDNASGTAVVMEVARVMKLNQFNPKRTIVFALWAAEEEGLLGSKYYTENPVYPLEKTVANINLDMEGHGTGKVNARGAYYTPEVWDILKTRLPKEILDNTISGRGGPGGSDHTHFLYNGVPAFMVSTDGPHFKTNRVGDVIDLIKPEILKKSGDFVVAAAEVLSTEPEIPILAKRKEMFYWRYETVVDYGTPALDAFIEANKDVQDPDVDTQLAVIDEKAGSSSDALRLEVMKGLIAGKEKLAASKGLSFYGAPAQRPMGGGMLGPSRPAKTTVVAGLRGIASIRDDLRWAEVFSRQGAAFVALEQPGFMFGEKGLSDEGKKVTEALAKANLLLVVKGLNPAQTKALLESAKKPVGLLTASLPGEDILGLVKNTNSVVGIMLGKADDAASYVKKIDAGKKVVGAEYIAIVAENSLWGSDGKEQMINVLTELLKAKYENEELANLFSGAFMRALNRARAEVSQP